MSTKRADRTEIKKMIREQIKDMNYRRMLLYMYEQANIDQDIIWNIIECLDNPKKYRSDIINRLEELKNSFMIAKQSTPKQKEKLTNMLIDGTKDFNKLDDKIKKPTVTIPLLVSSPKPESYLEEEEEGR